jgi:hypothetical protein
VTLVLLGRSLFVCRPLDLLAQKSRFAQTRCWRSERLNLEVHVLVGL